MGTKTPNQAELIVIPNDRFQGIYPKQLINT